MGLFNFFYKLTNILSNKRKLRVFIIIVLIFLIVFFWSRGAFAATSPTDADALTNYQLCLQQAVFSQLTDLVKAGLWDPLTNTNFVNNVKYNFVYLQPSVNENAQMIIHIYRLNRNDNGVIRNTPQDFNIPGSWSVTATTSGTSTEYQCMLAEFWGPTSVYYYGRPPTITTPEFIKFYIPDACFCVRSTAINDFLIACGEVSELPPTYNTSDAELQAITRSGFNNQVQAINNMNQTVEDVNSSVQDVNDSVQQVNQSVNEMIAEIVSPYVNVSQEQLPTQEVTDTTQEPLNTLFDYIKDAFTGEPQGFTIPLPFVNADVVLEPNFIQNAMRNARAWCFSYFDRGLLVV